jgi:branched-subunit amino acid aminotransferase/4-amino-4-deoxychorismate lyase
LEIKEGDIPLEKIKEYDEHFITGTTLNVMPVRQIDNVILRKGAGEKVTRLQNLFKECCTRATPS